MIGLVRRNSNGSSLFPSLNFGTNFDRLFDSFFEVGPERTAGKMNIDFIEKDDRFEIVADLPGVKEQDLNVTLEDGILTIGCTRQESRNDKGDSYHIRERVERSVSRSMKLPVSADPDSIDARLADGVLTVQLKKNEQTKRRQITVKKS